MIPWELIMLRPLFFKSSSLHTERHTNTGGGGHEHKFNVAQVGIISVFS